MLISSDTQHVTWGLLLEGIMLQVLLSILHFLYAPTLNFCDGIWERSLAIVHSSLHTPYSQSLVQGFQTT